MNDKATDLRELESSLRTVCEFHTSFVICLGFGLLILFVSKLNTELHLGLNGELWLFTGRCVVAFMITSLCVATIRHAYLIRKILDEERAEER